MFEKREERGRRETRDGRMLNSDADGWITQTETERTEEYSKLARV